MNQRTLLLLGGIVAASACGRGRTAVPAKIATPARSAAAISATSPIPPVSSRPLSTVASATKSIVEVRILDAAQFDDPRAKLAYMHAKEIPDRLSKMHCYCECDTNPALRHTSLLSCYEDGHAAECGICQSEEEQAYKDYKAGRPVEDSIRSVEMMYGNAAMHME